MEKIHNARYPVVKGVSILFLSIIFVLIQTVNAQDYTPSDQRTESVLSLMGLGADKMPLTQMPDLKEGTMLMASIDEDEYRVDAGDVFVIKVDVKGPAFKIFNSIVTPDGYLIIPDAPTVYVRYLTLREAKKEIDKVLRKSFPQAEVESHLFQVHAVRISVLGALPRPGKIVMNSSDRLFDAVTGMMDPFIADTTILFNWEVVSFRNVEIQRKNGTQKFDLLRYKLMGDRLHNPYLMDDDIVYINYKDSTRFTIYVSGSVSRPIEFEYNHGDRLMTAIHFAGDLLPTADSSRIELIRIDEKTKGLSKKILTFPRDSNYVLQPDDRIFVREKIPDYKKYSVFIEGEVKYPGEYAIENGKTTLSDIIAQAGGFTEDAAVLRSSVQRMNINLVDKTELRRLKNVRQVEMTVEEASYFRLRSRENWYMVTVDYNKLFNENDKSCDILLFDQDLITIPERTMTVFVSGGVVSPGSITLRSEWDYEEYINAAGGYTDLAREGWTIIINSRTGKWNDADDGIPINEGDIIFVPERDRVDIYTMFVDGLAIIAQVSAVILVVVTLAK